ncbi:MAG: hypothetical protein K2G64_07865 [Muribaculaceae bacterium]|nr:hypothetical protein [Muribaculaceae bacterium]MDE5969004.1 hypothetical protein [Muribaculaceae bacterium]MDE7394307.1 hypothetical protein [Muribaculaceae bacterium]
MENKCKCKSTEEFDVDNYVGAAADVVDKEKTDAAEVKADIKELNNNPRNNGDPV